ncbi:glycosyltransferase family 4 protein [Pseudomonas sp. S3_E11]
MKILMLCTKFSLSENDPWLTNELADSFQELGHEVTVLCLDWSASPNSNRVDLKLENGVEVISLPPVLVRSPLTLVSKALKWGLSSFSAYRISRGIVKQKNIDIVVSFSPSVTMALPIMALASRKNLTSLLIQWDFFPHHHRQIGLISSGISFFIARKMEEMLIRKFDVVSCMSPANEVYLRTHYPIRDEQKVCITPVWGKDAPLEESNRIASRKKYALPPDRPLVVFGGQLVHGRGLEDLINTAKLAQQGGSSVTFVVIGSGVLDSLVKACIAEGCENLIWISRIPRDEYLGLIKACDLALVCTVRDVDVPSFPSKTIDYLRASLPIVASVEASTDYGDYIAALGVGISVNAGEPVRLLESIEGLLGQPDQMKSMSRLGPIRFREVFEVKHVTSELLKMVE